MNPNFTHFITAFTILCITIVVSSKTGGQLWTNRKSGRTLIEGSGSGSGPGVDDEDGRAFQGSRRGSKNRYAPTPYSSTAHIPNPASPTARVKTRNPYLGRRPLPEDSRPNFSKRPNGRSPSDNDPRDEGSGAGDTVDAEGPSRSDLRKEPLPAKRPAYTLNVGPTPRVEVPLGPQVLPARSCYEVRRTFDRRTFPYFPECSPNGGFAPFQCEGEDCMCVNTNDGTVIEKTVILKGTKIMCKMVRYRIQIPLQPNRADVSGNRRQFVASLESEVRAALSTLAGQHVVRFKSFMSRSSRDSPDGVELECDSIGHKVPTNFHKRLASLFGKSALPLGDVRGLNVTEIAGKSGRSGGLPNSVRRSRLAGDEPGDHQRSVRTVNEEQSKRKDSEKPVSDGTSKAGDASASKNTKGDKKVTTLFKQPGIIAAIIGGGIAGFFLAILLILFCIYRIRKKDEGSYALEEPKKTPVSAAVYHSAPTREYYA